MTKVSDQDLVLLRTSEDREACTGGTQDMIDAVLAELLALRRAADVLRAAFDSGRCVCARCLPALHDALREAGR